VTVLSKKVVSFSEENKYLTPENWDGND